MTPKADTAVKTLTPSSRPGIIQITSSAFLNENSRISTDSSILANTLLIFVMFPVIALSKDRKSAEIISESPTRLTPSTTPDCVLLTDGQ
jgi:hypothetical protein